MQAVQEWSISPGALALETVRAWTWWLIDVERRLMPPFARREARRHVGASLRGLRSPVERKNGWPWAAVSGAATPDGLQHLLGRAQWAAEAVRDERRRYGLARLGEPQAVRVRDETGVLKKGQSSVGVARPWSGTAGRVEHGQRGVLLPSASTGGQAVLARALYLPPAWTNAQERCARAGGPATQPFATQPQLARQMRQRACEARVPAAWVTGDRV